MENPQIQLIKRQESFNLVITDELEKKIRFLCDKLPRNEYSGTLFYTIEGSFKDNDLKVVASDFFLQDVGEAAYTEFQNNVDLAGYIARHELWDHYMGLMHSHNQMSAFFSGTDTATLRDEGKDTNHFVSLIVNNAGKYCAAITRKVHAVVEGFKRSSYNSFNDEHINEAPVNFEREESYVEYYPLNIIMPEAAPKSELELRLEEVKKNASSYINRKYPSSTSYPYSYPRNPSIILPPTTHQVGEPKEHEVKETKSAVTQLSLFSKEEMGEIKNNEEIADIPYDEVHVDPALVKDSICQLITGDIFSIYKQNVDIDKWVSNMETLYTRRFGSPENDNFKYWIDNILDFLVEGVQDDKLVENGEDFVWAIWAYDMIVALEEFPKNKYLEVIINSLNRWII